MILETMGRYTGRIALEAGLADAADTILLPEITRSPKAVAGRNRTVPRDHPLLASARQIGVCLG